MTDRFDDDDDALDVDELVAGGRTPYDADGFVEPSHIVTSDDEDDEDETDEEREEPGTEWP